MSQELIIWATGLARQARNDELVKQGEQVAALLQGRIVSSDDDAAAVTDLVKRVKAGSAAVKRGLDAILDPLRRAQEAARGEVAGVLDVLARAEAAGKQALSVWMTEKERRAREEQERRRREQEAAEAAAREAAKRGEEDAPPVEEPPPPPVERVTRGQVGQSFGTSRLSVEMLDVHAVAAFDPSLLKLDSTTAMQLYRLAEKREELNEAETRDGGVLWHGMFFRRERSVAIR